MKGIGTRLAVQIAVVLIVVMTLFGMYATYAQKHTFTARFQKKKMRALQQFSLAHAERFAILLLARQYP